MLKENILANQCNLMMWATTEASKEQRALKNNGEMRERTKSNVFYNKGRYFYNPKKFFSGYGYIFVSKLTIIYRIHKRKYMYIFMQNSVEHKLTYI